MQTETTPNLIVSMITFNTHTHTHTQSYSMGRICQLSSNLVCHHNIAFSFPFKSLLFLPPAYVVRGKVIFIPGNVCLFTLGGGTLSSLGQGGDPNPALDGGVPNPALDWGGVPIQPWTGGYPNLGWGGTPSLGGTPTLDGGYPISGGYSNLGRRYPISRGLPQPWTGGTPSLGGTPTLDRGVPHLRVPPPE